MKNNLPPRQLNDWLYDQCAMIIGLPLALIGMPIIHGLKTIGGIKYNG